MVTKQFNVLHVIGRVGAQLCLLQQETSGVVVFRDMVRPSGLRLGALLTPECGVRFASGVLPVGVSSLGRHVFRPLHEW